MRYFDKIKFSLGQVAAMLAIALMGTAVIGYASSVTTPHTFTAGTTISASEMNNNFAAIKAAVDDNDSRITSLTTGMGRIFLPAPSSTGTFELPNGVSTSVNFSVGKPDDYTSGTMTINVLLSGCGGQDIRVTLHARQRVIGVNSSLIVLPIWSTFSMPANPSTIQFYIAEHTGSSSGFGDFLEINFARDGGDAADTCTGSAYLRGVIVEYPRS